MQKKATASPHTTPHKGGSFYPKLALSPAKGETVHFCVNPCVWPCTHLSHALICLYTAGAHDSKAGNASSDVSGLVLWFRAFSRWFVPLCLPFLVISRLKSLLCACVQAIPSQLRAPLLLPCPSRSVTCLRSSFPRPVSTTAFTSRSRPLRATSLCPFGRFAQIGRLTDSLAVSVVWFSQVLQACLRRVNQARALDVDRLSQVPAAQLENPLYLDFCNFFPEDGTIARGRGDELLHTDTLKFVPIAARPGQAVCLSRCLPFWPLIVCLLCAGGVLGSLRARSLR